MQLLATRRQEEALVRFPVPLDLCVIVISLPVSLPFCSLQVLETTFKLTGGSWTSECLSQDCANKLLPTWCLKSTKIFSLTSSGDSNLRSMCWQGCASFKGSGRILPYSFQFDCSSLGCGCNTPICFHLPQSSPLSLSSLRIRTRVIG